MPVKPPTHQQTLKAKLPKPRDTRASAHARGYGGKAWAYIRRQVLVRDGGVCQTCGAVLYRKGQAHVDHIRPKSEGGTDDPGNLQTLCASCHSRKTGRQSRGVGGGNR